MTETARMYGGSLYDLAAEEGWRPAFWASWTRPWRFLRQAGVPASAQHPQHPQKGALRPAGRSAAGSGPPLCAELFEDPVREGHPAGAARLRPGLPGALQSGTRYSGSSGNHCSGNDRAAGEEPARKAGEAHRQDHRPENKRSIRLCWAASGWISRAPSWTAPSRTALPPCAGILRRSLCNIPLPFANGAEHRTNFHPK